MKFPDPEGKHHWLDIIAGNKTAVNDTNIK